MQVKNKAPAIMTGINIATPIDNANMVMVIKAIIVVIAIKRNNFIVLGLIIGRKYLLPKKPTLLGRVDVSRET